jgi:hypothetical protein
MMRRLHARRIRDRLRAAATVSWSETFAAFGCVVLLLVTLFGGPFRPSVAAKTCTTPLSTAEHQRPCTSHRNVTKAVHILVATLALSCAVMALAELPAQPTAKAAVVQQPLIAGLFTDGASAALRAHLSLTAAEDGAAQPSLAAGTSAHARNRMHARTHAHPRFRCSNQSCVAIPLSLSLPNRWCFFAAVTKETDVVIKEMDIQLREALLKQFELTKEKDALTKEKDALLAAFTKEKVGLTTERDALAMEKDALAKQLAAAISTCAAQENSTDRSVEIRAAGAYLPNQAAAAGTA